MQQLGLLFVWQQKYANLKSTGLQQEQIKLTQVQKFEKYRIYLLWIRTQSTDTLLSWILLVLMFSGNKNGNGPLNEDSCY